MAKSIINGQNGNKPIVDKILIVVYILELEYSPSLQFCPQWAYSHSTHNEIVYLRRNKTFFLCNIVTFCNCEVYKLIVRRMNYFVLAIGRSKLKQEFRSKQMEENVIVIKILYFCQNTIGCEFYDVPFFK